MPCTCTPFTQLETHECIPRAKCTCLFGMVFLTNTVCIHSHTWIKAYIYLRPPAFVVKFAPKKERCGDLENSYPCAIPTILSLKLVEFPQDQTRIATSAKSRANYSCGRVVIFALRLLTLARPHPCFVVLQKCTCTLCACVCVCVRVGGWVVLWVVLLLLPIVCIGVLSRHEMCACLCVFVSTCMHTHTYIDSHAFTHAHASVCMCTCS